MFYTLKVEWDDGDKSIIIGNEENTNDAENSVINKVIIHMDTIDDDTNTKSGQMLARVQIEGKIPKDQKLKKIYEKLADFFAWSIDNNSTTYRKVTIKVNNNDGEKLREYVFENLFVRDYQEIYDSTSGDKDGIFKIDLTQRENELHTINVL